MVAMALAALVAVAPFAGCGNVKPRELSTQERTVQGLPPTTDVEERFGITGEPLAPEIGFDLPATSRPEEWLRFKVRNVGRHFFAIDPNSVTQGSDGIVRYSLLVRTTGGVDNITHEGIRCATNSWKLYAVGRDNGEWSRLPAPVWRPIVTAGLNAVRYTLSADYVCDRDGVPYRDAQMVAARIRASNEGRLDMTVR
jgi:hypothetical protein